MLLVGTEQGMDRTGHLIHSLRTLFITSLLLEYCTGSTSLLTVMNRSARDNLRLVLGKG
jgi:hypothetical protein